MLLLILVPTLLFFAGMIVYISYTANEIVQKDAELILEAHGESLAGDLGLQLEKAMNSSEVVAQKFQGIIENGDEPSREDAIMMLQQLIENNSQFVTTWMFWKPNAFDGKDEEYINETGHDETGLFIPVWARTGEGNVLEPQIGYEEGEVKELFDHVFESGQNTIYEPIFYEIDGEDTLITSIISPVVINGETIGMVGVDFSLNIINNYVSDFTFYDTGFAGLISNSGIVLAHQNEDLIGTNYFESDVMKNYKHKDAIKEAVESGEKKLVEGRSGILNTDVYRLFTPIKVEDVSAPWSAFLAAPINEVTKEAKDLTVMILSVSLGIIVILAVIILFVTNSIVRPIRAAVDHGREMASGDFTRLVPEHFLKRKDETGELAHIFKAISENMRELIGKVQDSSRMVLQSAQSMEEGANQSS